MSESKIFEPNVTHLMIDIESLGLQETCAPIISIAMVPFTMEDKVKEANIECLFTELHPSAKIEIDAVKFWMNQNAEAKNAAFGSMYTQTHALADALRILTEKYRIENCQTIWCRGLQFDMTNIEFYMRMYNIKIPWAYNDRLDVRPFARLLTKEIQTNIYTTYNAHNPVQDCLAQIDIVQNVVRRNNYA